MQEVVHMPRQESTAVVRAGLADLEARLVRVEDWSQFLAGLDRVERTGYGRYRFHVRQGSSTFDVPVAVTRDAKAHRISWRSLEGPTLSGEFRLAPVDEHHTRAHLVVVSEPRGFAANVAAMVTTTKDEATIDLQRLEALVAG
jgi:uncharacterized membrane protein